jgi:hypothetical protein
MFGFGVSPTKSGSFTPCDDRGHALSPDYGILVARSVGNCVPYLLQLQWKAPIFDTRKRLLEYQSNDLVLKRDASYCYM